MFFKFLKYIHPTWYYHLPPLDNSANYWLDYRKLSNEEKKLIYWDENYKTIQSSLCDASFQAWQKGFISNNPENLLQLPKDEEIPSEDNYRFMSKYYGKSWLTFIFIIRIFSLHNPLREAKNFYKVLSITRVDLNNPIKEYPDYSHLNISNGLKTPLVSIIIPTLGRYEYLKDALYDLEHQHFKNFEVIVVDQNDRFNEEFYKPYQLDLKIIKQEEKALWLARNTAIKESKGELILLFDDDSRVNTDWIIHHLKCLKYFNVEISSGVSVSVAGDIIPKHYTYFRWSDQIDTGNVMLYREVFKKTGLFDRQFEKQRMGDGEFGLRCYLAGFKNISNPFAKRIHLKVGSGGLRQMGSWDGYRPKSLFSPRPIPSILYYFRKYYGERAAILSLIKNIPPSIIPYRFKRNKKLLAMGIILFPIVSPIIFLQVLYSWYLSGKKIREGAIIDEL